MVFLPGDLGVFIGCGFKLVTLIADSILLSLLVSSDDSFSCSSIIFHISLKFSDLIEEFIVAPSSLLIIDVESESVFILN